jgi:hypothetical protein
VGRKGLSFLPRNLERSLGPCERIIVLEVVHFLRHEISCSLPSYYQLTRKLFSQEIPSCVDFIRAALRVLLSQPLLAHEFSSETVLITLSSCISPPWLAAFLAQRSFLLLIHSSNTLGSQVTLSNLESYLRTSPNQIQYLCFDITLP